MGPDRLLEMRKFLAPEFVFGTGAIDLTGQYAHNLGSSRALIVTDPGVRKAGWVARVQASLDHLGVEHRLYENVSPNPRDAEVAAGAALFQEAGCDTLVAVGGGSPMDCAKGIGIVVANGRPIRDFEGVDQVAEPMPLTLCVPTTGGTAADVSQFAIITRPEQRRKIAIVSKAVVPDVALIDPETLTTMDPYLTACTGLDALVHAMEAIVSQGASSLTHLHAREAIRLVTGHLLPCLESPLDVGLRGRIMLGSLHAGLAFSNASLGAVHAMAHSLGGLLDLPHGECNALLLEHVVAFNLRDAPDGYRAAAEAMGLDLASRTPADMGATLLDALRSLREAARVSGALESRGVHRSDVADLAAKALEDACMVTNPRVPNQRDIEVIFEEAL